MSSMDNGEPLEHRTEARFLLECALGRHGRSDAPAENIAAAQVHATLALAEQQRIANLIALGQFRILPSEIPYFRHLVVRPLNDDGIDIQPDLAVALARNG